MTALTVWGAGMDIESVVHVISDAGPHPYFRTLIEADPRDRRRLTVGCVGPAGHLQAEMAELGVETFALGARSRASYPRAVARLARILRARGAQIVQTHLVDGSLVGLAAARLARTPVAVFTAHHSHELPFHGARLRWADRACAGPLSDHVIAPSREVARTLSRLAGARADKIEVVHHGFDLERLDPARVSGDRVRAELGLDGALVFGSIGRLYRLKDQAALLRAFAAALAYAPDTRLLVVGAGDREPLAALAQQLGIVDRVVFAGARADVPSVLAALDAFVHPALAESFGMVIVEAMAMGRPVLSTPVGIAPEVIESGATGVLARATGTDALADGLRELVALRPRWGELGASARARVAGFTARGMADAYEALYERWLAEKAG
jgi:glycosyltransferase involved in cell wall biosynthesis